MPSIMVMSGRRGIPFSHRVSMEARMSTATVPIRSTFWSMPKSAREEGQFIVAILGLREGGSSASTRSSSACLKGHPRTKPHFDLHTVMERTCCNQPSLLLPLLLPLLATAIVG